MIQNEDAMTGHEFQSGSSLQDWITHELSHLTAQEQADLARTDFGDRNLSLRVPLALHLMLSRIAEKLDRSKSAVSEEILTWAVRDVYKQFDLPPLTHTDLTEFAAQIEKTPAEKSALTKKNAR